MTMMIEESQAKRWLGLVMSGGGLVVCVTAAFLAMLTYSYKLVLFTGAGYVTICLVLIYCSRQIPAVVAVEATKTLLVPQPNPGLPAHLQNELLSPPRLIFSAVISLFYVMTSVAWVADRIAREVDYYGHIGLSDEFSLMQLLRSADFEGKEILYGLVLVFVLTSTLLMLLYRTMVLESHEGYRRMAKALSLFLLLIGLALGDDIYALSIGVGLVVVGLLLLTLVRWVSRGFDNAADVSQDPEGK